MDNSSLAVIHDIFRAISRRTTESDTPLSKEGHVTRKTKPFDAAKHFTSAAAQARLLSDALATGLTGYIANALGTVARGEGGRQARGGSADASIRVSQATQYELSRLPSTNSFKLRKLRGSEIPEAAMKFQKLFVRLQILPLRNQQATIAAQQPLDTFRWLALGKQQFVVIGD